MCACIGREGGKWCICRYTHNCCISVSSVTLLRSLEACMLHVFINWPFCPCPLILAIPLLFCYSCELFLSKLVLQLVCLQCWVFPTASAVLKHSNKIINWLHDSELHMHQHHLSWLVANMFMYRCNDMSPALCLGCTNTYYVTILFIMMKFHKVTGILLIGLQATGG